MAETIHKQAAARGLPPPKVFADAPLVFPWLLIYWKAWHELDSERRYSNGPIPWTSRALWARAHGLDDVQTKLLHTHVCAMDIAFKKWLSDNAPKGPAPGTPRGQNG